MKIIRPRLTSGALLIGRYSILEEIGQGGMQQVYLAKDNALDRRVALKVPINASAQKRFERSARLSANIVHPNIAKTLDYAVAGEIEFLVEELIPGSDLQQRLDGVFNTLDPHLVAHVIHHVAKAVCAMNNKGIIHRDLKPSNIMVSNDMAMFEVKVTDFGVATMADAEINEAVKGGQDSIAASKTVVGALAFMAPELIKRADDVDRSKCDAWSVGALLYFLLFGEYPFGNELAAIQNILNGTFKDRSGQAATAKLQFRELFTSLWKIASSSLIIDVERRPTIDQIVSSLSKVTYSGAQRKLGKIKYIHPGQGSWNFIAPDHDDEDVFFHFDSFIGGRPEKGQRVTFADFPGAPQRRAFPVVPCRV